MGRVETGIFTWELYEELSEQAKRKARSYESYLGDILANLGPDFQAPTVTDKEKHKEALAVAQEMKTKQEGETATLGRIFARDADKANAFSKLSRYETTIERGLYKALHELERRQAARQGGNVPAPVAMDVEVSGIPGGDR